MTNRKIAKSFYGIALLAGVLFLAQCSSGQTTDADPNTTPETTERGSGDALTGCVEGDCANGTGTYVYDTGDKYIGPFKNGLRDGNGTMMYANGDIYKGPYVADKRTGEGIYTFANGDVYKGEFRDGLRGGQGEYIWKEDGAIFKGEFAQDGASGKGILIVDGSQRECVLEQRKVICEDGSSRETEQG